MRLLRAVALILVGLPFAASPAFATEFPAVGSNGDAPFRDDCTAGQYLIGLKGRAGAWIDQVGLICAPIQADLTSGPKSYGPARGGNGGTPVDQYCASGTVATSMSLHFTKDMKQVFSIDLTCTSVRTWQEQQPPASLEPVNLVTATDNLDVDPGANPTQTCPQGEVASGLNGQYGRHVNALGLICDEFKVASAAPSSGFQVGGDIGAKWQSLGAAGGILGAATTNEMGTPDGVGRYNHFVNGSIYWTPQLGAHEIHGAIVAKWASMGWEKSSLGYPTTDETGTPDGVGRYNHFQNGSIYWTPTTGAFEVEGLIRAKWAELGWEKGPLGYPISDEFQDGNYRRSNFQRGFIRWSAVEGALVTVQPQ